MGLGEFKASVHQATRRPGPFSLSYSRIESRILWALVQRGPLQHRVKLVRRIYPQANQVKPLILKIFSPRINRALIQPVRLALRLLGNERSFVLDRMATY